MRTFALANKQDESALVAYWRPETSFNTFNLGDLHIYGFDSDGMKIWIQRDDEVITATYLLYVQTLVVYSATRDWDADFLLRLTKQHRIENIMGKREFINWLRPLGFQDWRPDYKHFAQMEKLIEPAGDIDYQIATLDDAKAISEILATCFDKIDYPEEMIVQKLKNHEGRHFFIKENGRIIAHANSAAETPYSALIGGVCTLPGYRKKGYASRLVSALCQELLSEGKLICLTVDDPQALSIYQRLGFEIIGEWGFLLDPKP
jgi:predicted GNAT family acetyltransferase